MLLAISIFVATISIAARDHIISTGQVIPQAR